MPNYGLSIRKNLESGQFQVYRRFTGMPSLIIATQNGNIAGVEGKYAGSPIQTPVEIIFEGKFFEAVARAEEELNRFHPE